ncbi:unnamed protein product [Amoebophrya sp. A25]|nr:unnamed protein product [Amoebophrya sp. A25]|eukprot:GSA25T00005206001.1
MFAASVIHKFFASDPVQLFMAPQKASWAAGVAVEFAWSNVVASTFHIDELPANKNITPTEVEPVQADEQPTQQEKTAQSKKETSSQCC